MNNGVNPTFALIEQTFLKNHKECFFVYNEKNEPYYKEEFLLLNEAYFKSIHLDIKTKATSKIKKQNFVAWFLVLAIVLIFTFFTPLSVLAKGLFSVISLVLVCVGYNIVNTKINRYVDIIIVTAINSVIRDCSGFIMGNAIHDLRQEQSGLNHRINDIKTMEQDYFDLVNFLKHNDYKLWTKYRDSKVDIADNVVDYSKANSYS